MKKSLLSTVVAPLYMIGAFAANAMEEDPDANFAHALAQEARERNQHWDPDASPPKEMQGVIDRHTETTQYVSQGYIEDEHVLIAAELLRTHQELKSPNGLARALHEYGFDLPYAKVLANQVFREDHGGETEDFDPAQESAREIARAAKRRLDTEFDAIAAHELTSAHGLKEGQNARLFLHILDGDDLNPSGESSPIIPVN